MEANQVVAASWTWSATRAARKVMPSGNVHGMGSERTRVGIEGPQRKLIHH